MLILLVFEEFIFLVKGAGVVLKGVMGFSLFD